MRLASSLRLGWVAALLAVCSPAQIAPLKKTGDSYATLRGFLPSIQFVRAGDGSGRERVLLDPNDPNLTFAETPSSNGVRYTLQGQVATQNFGSIPVDVVVDAVGSRALGYDLSVQLRSVPATLAVECLGVAVELEDRPGKQSVLVPAFSGVVFEEPATTIPTGRDVDTEFATSMQVTCYWSDDDTGLRIQMLDPTGNEPKRFRYEPVTVANLRGLRIDCAYWMPNTDKGGVPVQTPHSIRIDPYTILRGIEDGWFTAAKRYREWVLTEATDPGELLEKGPLATRSDVPTWLRELDLFVTEQFGWFPDGALVQDPMLALERHKQQLGAAEIFVGLWSWTDRRSPYGLNGSWIPRPETIQQFRKLEQPGIRVSGYTYPQAFDIRNPLLIDFLLWQAIVQRRDGSFVTSLGGGGEIFATMDVGDPLMAWWFGILGEFHSREFGLSGFYTDLPVAAGTPDFRRPQGLPRGTSRIGYEGFANLHESARAGAARANRDFALYHEACFEWLIRSANFGQGATNLFGRAYPGETKTYAVPFFQAAFSGYTAFWPADPGLGTQTLEFVPEAYGDFLELNASRLLAEGVTLGGIPNTSEIFLREGKLFYEVTFNDPALDNWLQHHKLVLKNAIALRKRARPWLVYGEMLNDPVVGGDFQDMTLNVSYVSKGTVKETFSKPLVSSRAWKAADETVRIVAFNGSGNDGTARYDLLRVGLAGSRTLVDTVSQESFKAVNEKGTWVFTIPVAAGSWRLLEPR